MAEDLNNLSDMLGYGDANSSRASSLYTSRRDGDPEEDAEDCSGDVCITVDESSADLQSGSTALASAPAAITPSRLPSRSLIPTPKRGSHRPPPRRHSPATPTHPGANTVVNDTAQYNGENMSNDENSPYVPLAFTPGNTKLDQKSLQALQRKFGRARSLSPGLKATDSSRNVSENHAGLAADQTSELKKPAITIEVAPPTSVVPREQPPRSVSAPRPSLIPRRPTDEATTPKQKKKLAVSFKSPAIEPSPGAPVEESAYLEQSIVLPAVTPSENSRKSKAGHTPGYIPKYRGGLSNRFVDEEEERLDDADANPPNAAAYNVEEEETCGDEEIDDMSNLVESFAHENPTSPPANPDLVPVPTSVRNSLAMSEQVATTPLLSPVLPPVHSSTNHTLSMVPVPYDTPYLQPTNNRSRGSTSSSLRYSTSDCDSESRNVATPWAANYQPQSAFRTFPHELVASAQAASLSTSTLDSPPVQSVATTRKSPPQDKFNYGAMNTLEVRSTPPQLQFNLSAPSARSESRPVEMLHQPFASASEPVSLIGGPKLTRIGRDAVAPVNKNGLGLPQPANNPQMLSQVAPVGNPAGGHMRTDQQSSSISSPLDFSNKHDDELYQSLGIQDQDDGVSAKPSRPVDHRDRFPAHSVGGFANASQGPRARGLARPAPGSIGSPIQRMPGSVRVGAEDVVVARRLRRDAIDAVPVPAVPATDQVIPVTSASSSGALKLNSVVRDMKDNAVVPEPFSNQQIVQAPIVGNVQLQAPQTTSMPSATNSDPGAVSLSRPGLRKRNKDQITGVGTALTQVAKMDAQPFLSKTEPSMVVQAQISSEDKPTDRFSVSDIAVPPFPAAVEVPDVNKICAEVIRELNNDSSIIVPIEEKVDVIVDDDIGLDSVMGKEKEKAVVGKSPLKANLLQATAPALGTTVASRVPCDPNANDSIVEDYEDNNEEKEVLDEFHSSRENIFKSFYWNKAKDRASLNRFAKGDPLNQSTTSVTTLGIDDATELEQSQSESGNDALMCFTSRAVANGKKAQSPPEDVKEIILHGKVGYTTSITLSFRNKRSTPHSINAKAILHRFEAAEKSPNTTKLDNSGVFKVVSDADGNETIPPMGQGSVIVEFAPAANGVYSGILKIRSQRKAFVMLLRGESMPDDAFEGEVSIVQSGTANITDRAALTSPSKPSRSNACRSNSVPNVRSPMVHAASPAEKVVPSDRNNYDPSYFVPLSYTGRSMDDSIISTSLTGNEDCQTSSISPKCALLKQWVKKQLEADKYGGSRSHTRDVCKMSQSIRSQYPMQFSPNPMSIAPLSHSKQSVFTASKAIKNSASSTLPVTITHKSDEASSALKNKVYFRRSGVDFGTVCVGKMSRMKVEICNSSDREVVVRLSDPSLPFIVLHNEIAVPARSFVRLPVRFVPVSPSVFATEVYAQIVNLDNEVISVQFCGKAI